jgi:hypothetical protein
VLLLRNVEPSSLSCSPTSLDVDRDAQRCGRLVGPRFVTEDGVRPIDNRSSMHKYLKFLDPNSHTTGLTLALLPCAVSDKARAFAALVAKFAERVHNAVLGG